MIEVDFATSQLRGGQVGSKYQEGPVHADQPSLATALLCIRNFEHPGGIWYDPSRVADSGPGTRPLTAIMESVTILKGC
jgi:hypothetical protein